MAMVMPSTPASTPLVGGAATRAGDQEVSRSKGSGRDSVTRRVTGSTAVTRVVILYTVWHTQDLSMLCEVHQRQTLQTHQALTM
jgi:hypothetical protein